jgi:hypothetical protein
MRENPRNGGRQMLADDRRWTTVLIWVAFFATLEMLSWGQTSKTAPCILVSNEAQGENRFTGQACATMHEGVFRLLKLVWEHADHDNIVAFGTLAIAAFTFILYRATAKLWEASERQLAHLEVTAERQLRAYVFVTSSEVTNVAEGDGIPEAHVVIKNTGQTPAYDLVNVTGIAANRYPPPPGLILTVPEEELSEGRTKMSLGPGDVSLSNTSAGRSLTAEQRASVADGTGVVYVYGELRYRDAFGVQRWTKYRLMVGGPAGVRGGQLAGCAEGNDAN